MDAEGSNNDSQNIESHVSDFYVRDDIHLTADNPEAKNIPHTEKKAVPSQEWTRNIRLARILVDYFGYLVFS